MVGRRPLPPFCCNQTVIDGLFTLLGQLVRAFIEARGYRLIDAARPPVTGANVLARIKRMACCNDYIQAPQVGASAKQPLQNVVAWPARRDHNPQANH